MKTTVRNKKLFYEVSFLIGMILFLISLFFAINTLIGFLIPTLIFLIVGVTVFYFEKEEYNKTYGYNNYTYPLIHLMSSFGGIALFLFFSINYIFKSDKIEIQEYKIIDRYSSFGGKGKRNILHPNFTINYKKDSKVISFPEEFNDDIKHYKIIELKTSKGLLGFDILLDKKLK